MLFTTWLRPCSCSWSRPGWPCRRPGPRGSASRCRRLALGGVSGGILAFWMNMFLKMFLGTISTQRLWSQLTDCDLNSKIVFFSVLCVCVFHSLLVITLWSSHTLPIANSLQLSLKAWKMLRQLRPKLPWTQHAGLARWFLLSSEEERQWANI